MMIRPNNGQRMGGKPPPPVPPRPSKSIVAKALAKSRQFKSPTRQAPPPPPVTGINTSNQFWFHMSDGTWK